MSWFIPSGWIQLRFKDRNIIYSPTHGWFLVAPKDYNKTAVKT